MIFSSGLTAERENQRRKKHVFAVFGLTWSIFIESLKVLVFSGVEKEMPEVVYNGVSRLWLVWP